MSEQEGSELVGRLNGCSNLYASSRLSRYECRGPRDRIVCQRIPTRVNRRPSGTDGVRQFSCIWIGPITGRWLEINYQVPAGA